MARRDEKQLIVGIDLGGTNMQIGVVTPDHTIVGRCKRKTKAEQGCEAVVERIVEGVRRACGEAGVDLSDLAGVGIGAPGAIDIPRGVVLEAPNLRWVDVALKDLLESALGCSVIVDNDVNVAVWGEAKLGAGVGRRDMIGVWLGTGVGGGLVLNGQLWHGTRYTAGEIGQTVITPNGTPGYLTVEDHCSRTGMSHILRKLMQTDRTSILHEMVEENDGAISSKLLAEAVAAGDRLACRVVDHAAQLLGMAVSNWITVLSIDTVILGGGVTEALGETFVEKVNENFRPYVFPAKLQDCMIVGSRLRDDAGLLGAALLAQEQVLAAV